jgi:hypothetical protein
MEFIYKTLSCLKNLLYLKLGKKGHLTIFFEEYSSKLWKRFEMQYAMNA